MQESPYMKIDASFGSLTISHARLEQLWTGGRWLEGPVYWPDARMLVFSDVPNDRIMRWCDNGGTSVFRRPSMNANGNTRDRQGRLVTCEQALRRVTRTEHDGSITVLADRVDGKRFNSPNDVVVSSDGSVWFSDPDYGIRSDYEGHRAESEIGSEDLYRIPPDGSGVQRVRSDFRKPNGLAFSPDERTLYVSDTGKADDADGPPHIRRFSVAADGSLSGGDVFAVVDPPASDGFRVDEYGNVWTSAGDGVHCFAPDGRLLGKILVPERVSNVAFGGTKRNRLFITATTSLYAVYLAVRGA
ncbi:MAG: SMP-30/gluconolactonase/LRE family protein [Spirochaetota bacterium]